MKNALAALLLLTTSPAFAFPWEGSWSTGNGCVAMTAKAVYVGGKKAVVATVSTNKVGGWNLKLADGRFVEIEFNDSDSLAVTTDQTITDMTACH